MIKIFLLFFSTIWLYASVEVFGTSSIIKKDLIIVQNGLLIKDGMLISANRLEYNKKTNIIDAVGNVYINYDKSDYILSNHIRINLNNNQLVANPFFLFNFKDNSWINSTLAEQTNNIYLAKTSVASTCSVNNPDWKIESSSVKYNKKTKWVDMYNPRLYIKDIPVFYFPYLGFSLDRTRSSGFLRPLFGYSANEGFLFTLPYYQVLGPLADLEIDPTIRTKRGEGVYTTFRFVHSPTSYGEFRIGEFRDYKSYQEKYNLANRTHKGWSFLYKNYDLLSPTDKLYISLKSANDTDYFYLDAYNYTFNPITDKILTSNINYYLTNGDYNYFGIYGKYFIDTSKTSNADTMQILPQLNYHRFSDNFWNKFYFSIDANLYNYTREQGYTAVKKSILLPLTYSTNFFKDYLKVALTEQFSFNQVDQSNGISAKLLRLDTFLKLSTNLSKNYGNFIHNISPSITFGMDNYYDYNGVESDYLDVSKIKKSISFNLNQYLVSDKFSINHKLSEVYYLDTNAVNNRYSDLLNDLSIDYLDYYLKENNKYSPNTKKVSYNSITLGYDDQMKKFEANYIYQDDSSTQSQTYTLNGYWKYDGLHKLFGEYSYDIDMDTTKYYVVGISMKKKCWNYSLSYKKERLPLLTTDGISSIIQKTIYFEIELVPLGGIKQQYQLQAIKGK